MSYGPCRQGKEHDTFRIDRGSLCELVAVCDECHFAVGRFSDIVVANAELRYMHQQSGACNSPCEEHPQIVFHNKPKLLVHLPPEQLVASQSLAKYWHEKFCLTHKSKVVRMRCICRALGIIAVQAITVDIILCSGHLWRQHLS